MENKSRIATNFHMFRDVRLARDVLREKLQGHALQLNVSAFRMVVCHISLSDNLYLNAGFDSGYPGFQFRWRIFSFAARQHAGRGQLFQSRMGFTVILDILDLECHPCLLGTYSRMCPEPNERLFAFSFRQFLHWKKITSLGVFDNDTTIRQIILDKNQFFAR